MTSIGLNEVLLKNKINIIAGHFGSGKTEISLNTAVYMRSQNERITIVDLDIVNPYFRTAEQSQLLKEHDIDLLKPIYAATNVDIPSLPPDIMRIFAPDAQRALIDVGGDDTGAAALGGYAYRIADMDYSFFMVVNPYRPRTQTPEQIIDMYNAISRRARLSPTAIIANPNLADETTAECIAEGMTTIEEAAKQLNIPIAFIAVRDYLADELQVKYPVLPLKRYLKPEWMEI